MTISARNPLATYLHEQANLLRCRDLPSILAAHIVDQTHVLGDLVALVRSLPEPDERLLVLGTLAARDARFVPGGATQHAITGFAGTTPKARDAFLTNLVRIACDDSSELRSVLRMICMWSDARIGDRTCDLVSYTDN